mmetsp:Transcript_45064/g.116523  ORF Transcript_45064/g.116523 Transcript_45064/m.116523 type:complete len:88 (+) Transcript_45064:241-504(+)
MIWSWQLLCLSLFYRVFVCGHCCASVCSTVCLCVDLRKCETVLRFAPHHTCLIRLASSSLPIWAGTSKDDAMEAYIKEVEAQFAEFA